MASTKRKSPELDHDAPLEDGTRTPSPAKKRLRITRSQKQALIDNLQLEITERARKLRAQYALQANDLRARIERRVNRIPVALRKANMGELLEKYNSSARAQQEGATSKRPAAKVPKNPTTVPGGHTPRRVKRHSQENYSDKENAPAAGEPLDALKNPKTRGKTGAAAGGPSSRVVSQEVRGPDYRILSPKSLNSRTYPQSPFRASPEKPQHSSFFSRLSPVKPSSPLKSTAASLADSARARARAGATSPTKDYRPPSQAKKTTSRAATGSRAIRSPQPRLATRQHERKASTGTISSTASSGTTVIKPTRTGTGARKATAASTASGVAAKKPATARGQTASMAVKKTTATTAAIRKATAPAAVEAPATGRRVLRKRA